MINYKYKNYDNNKTLLENISINRNLPINYIEEKLFNIDIGINRIIKAIKHKEILGILVDEDSDGLNSGIILYKSLQKISNCIHLIVCKRENGYGIINKYYDEFYKLGITLVITADIGISNKQEIEYGKSLGIETIITDHHPILDEPKCIYINPSDIRNNNCTPYCGAGVAYIFMKELYKRLNKDFDINKTLLCHTGIATVGDLVPLIKNNYILVKETLNEFKNLHNKSKSLKWLINNGLSYVENRDYTSADISFGLVPMINSLHRISDSSKAIDFLKSDDENEIEILGNYIKNKNKERKNLQKLSVIEAIKIIENKKLYNDNIIFLDLDIKKTFAGLVASFITSDMYNKPSIVVSRDTNNIYYGSMRSNANCDLGILINKLKPYCISVGGHSKAGGITFDIKNINKIKNIVKEFGEEQYKLGLLNEDVYIVKNLNFDDINKDLINDINKLEPYGQLNPTPIFSMENLQIASMQCINFNTYFVFEKVNEGFFINDNIKSIHAVFFKRDYEGILECGDCVDIIFEITGDGTLLIKNLKESEMI